MPGPTGICTARRAVGRALVMDVAKAAVAASEEDAPLARPGQVGQHLPVLGIHDLGPGRDVQDEILAIGTGALAPGPGPAVRCAEMLAVTVVDQGVEVANREEDDVAALTAIAAVGAAELDELLAAEARRAAPSVAA